MCFDPFVGKTCTCLELAYGLKSFDLCDDDDAIR